MRRRRRLVIAGVAVAVVTVVLVIAWPPTSIGQRRTGTAPGLVATGAYAMGGEPAFVWLEQPRELAIETPDTGICVGIPTAVRAKGPHRLVIDFAETVSEPCPPDQHYFEIIVPASIDETTEVRTEIVVHGNRDHSIADDGHILGTIPPRT